MLLYFHSQEFHCNLQLLILVLICSMMLLAAWLQDLKRNEMKLGLYLPRQKGSTLFLHQMPYQQMPLSWAMGKEVLHLFTLLISIQYILYVILFFWKILSYLLFKLISKSCLSPFIWHIFVDSSLAINPHILFQ